MIAQPVKSDPSYAPQRMSSHSLFVRLTTSGAKMKRDLIDTSVGLTFQRSAMFENDAIENNKHNLRKN